MEAHDYKTLLTIIQKTVGIKEIDEQSARIVLEGLNGHFSDLTPKEIAEAFILCSVGTLDAYLPLNKFGQPDREHYQCFSLMYVSKILNAYKAYRTHQRALQMENEQRQAPKLLTVQNSKEWANMMLHNFRVYKDKGIYAFSPISEMLLSRSLKDMDMMPEYEVEEKDVREAYIRLRKQAEQGVIGDFLAHCIVYKGESHNKVVNLAESVALERVIRSVLDTITEEDFVKVVNYDSNILDKADKDTP